MDREPEQRRDLAMPDQQPYRIGGETFTIIRRETLKSRWGAEFPVVDVRHNVPFGRDR